MHQENNVDYFLDRILVAEAGEPAGLEVVQKAEEL